MSYSNSYFSKDLSDLAFEDIEHFFSSEKEESDKIEFKSNGVPSDEKPKERMNGILRTICGMLNSEGGIIIWGAPVGKEVDGRKEKVFQGDLTPVGDREEKDRFITRLTDSITPSPRGVRFQPLEKEGKFIYVLEVDKSPYSPHQFKDVYHMRIDGQTRPAPHHYIEALFRKVTFPNIQGGIQIRSFYSSTKEWVLSCQILIENLSPFQNEHELYCRVMLSHGEFDGHRSGGQTPDFIFEPGGRELRMKNLANTFFYNEPMAISSTIYIDKELLRNAANQMEVIVNFGGKKSPLRMSRYILHIDPVVDYSKDVNKLIMSRRENIYLHE